MIREILRTRKYADEPSDDCNSIAIVGRNEIAREGLRRILSESGFDIVGTASSATSLIEASEPGDPPGLIIIDSSSSASSNACCAQLREVFPDARIVVMSEDYSVESIARAMAAGCDGYVAKEISCKPLVGTLRLVALGEKVVPSQTVTALTEMPWRMVGDDWATNCADVRLSDREAEILRCLTRGDANKLISRELVITEATVKVHIKAILRKLGVMNRTQAAMWAVAHGLHSVDRVAAE